MYELLRNEPLYKCGPIKFEPLALSLSKGFDRLSLNRYLDFNGPDQEVVKTSFSNTCMLGVKFDRALYTLK